MKEVLTYKDAGVDIVKGDLLVEKIKAKVKSTYNENVVAGVGGFSCLYKIDEDRFLTAGTDGVGTKILLAQEMGIHSSIGQDLVAMCVNDIICCGAKPMFFMDYLACGKLDLEVSESLIDGVVGACKETYSALIGGETAEMPGLYDDGDYDLAGFAVGEVYKDKLIDGSKIDGSEKLIAIPSSGFHSNGYSLLRKLAEGQSDDLKKKLLEPTKLYVKLVQDLQAACPELLRGMAHITGGGLNNVARMNEAFNYIIDKVPNITSDEFKEEVSDVFESIANLSGLSDKELYTTFNMGMGFVIATQDSDKLMAEIKKAGHFCYEIGQLEEGDGKVILNGEQL
jgi:phosphoribosylformylglycinamidine cyclo-ligase